VTTKVPRLGTARREPASNQSTLLWLDSLTKRVLRRGAAVAISSLKSYPSARVPGLRGSRVVKPEEVVDVITAVNLLLFNFKSYLKEGSCRDSIT